ncbi:MAG: hypothetical protein EBY81_01570 [Verrucomicrobia bacterium]|nr:hypothetical protein [Verrucomicrobiota bacterium]
MGRTLSCADELALHYLARAVVLRGRGVALVLLPLPTLAIGACRVRHIVAFVGTCPVPTRWPLAFAILVLAILSLTLAIALLLAGGGVAIAIALVLAGVATRALLAVLVLVLAGARTCCPVVLVPVLVRTRAARRGRRGVLDRAVHVREQRVVHRLQ